MKSSRTYQVRLSARAERDVDQTLRWFHGQKATAAGERWLAQLFRRINTLETHPQRCRLAEEADAVGLELQELLFGRRQATYRILFVIQSRAVQILRIRHSARDALSTEDF